MDNNLKQKEIEDFERLSLDKLYIKYAPINDHFLEEAKIKTDAIQEIMKSEMKDMLEKSLRSYKENKRYLEDYQFSSYYWTSLKEYLNNLVDRGLIEKKEDQSS